MKFKRAKDEGFTLVEVIVATAILSLGLLICLKTITMGMDLRKRSKNLTMAAFFAQQKMEETFAGSITGADRGDGNGEFSKLTWKRSIQPMPEEPGMRRLRVVVTWEEGGVERDFVLESRLGDNRP